MYEGTWSSVVARPRLDKAVALSEPLERIPGLRALKHSARTAKRSKTQVLERLDALDKAVAPTGRWANPLERAPLTGKFLQTRRNILEVSPLRKSAIEGEPILVSCIVVFHKKKKICLHIVQ